jgi:hypothetical protein
MPTSPEALTKFLEYLPLPPPLKFRGDSRERLLAMIESVGGHELLTKTDPYAHQIEGLAFALWAERALLFYEPRTGKTKIALDWLSYLIYSGLLKRKALIITHAPIGSDEWEHQVRRHSYLDVLAIRSGGGYTAEQFFYALRQRLDAVLISWSTLQTIFSTPGTVPSGSKKGSTKRYADRHLLRQVAPAFDAVVIDEIHQAGHEDTLRFAIASELVAKCRWRLGLTGTPVGRSPLLLWAQAALIDGGRTLSASPRFFREAFCTTKPNRFKKGFNPFDWVFDNKKLPILRDKMVSISLHCALRDVQEVNVLKGVVELSMSPEQARAYDEAIDRLVKLKQGDAVEIENVFIRLRQIASGFLPFVDGDGVDRIIDFPDASKLAWLDDFFGNLPDLQIVVMHEFIRSGRRICELLDAHKIKYDWLRGGTTDRPALLERFRTGQTQVLVANTATGGMAIDLSPADYLLFFESTPSVIIRRQAEARPLARGDRPLILDDLVCAPIERKLLDFLDQGEGLREALLRDPTKLAEQLRS